MHLAALKISTSEFDTICEHVLNYSSHQNLHLRDTKQLNGKRTLRHILVVRAKSASLLEAMVAGEIFCRFQIVKLPNRQTQINVLNESGDPKLLERFARRLLSDLMKRVESEKADHEGHPRYSPGQYYVRRGAPGTPILHKTSQQALNEKILQKQFLELLEAWNLRLFRGRSKKVVR